MRISNIKWETDGEQVDLPTEVEVPDTLDEFEVADYLSDNYGWLVESFEFGDNNPNDDVSGDNKVAVFNRDYFKKSDVMKMTKEQVIKAVRQSEGRASLYPFHVLERLHNDDGTAFSGCYIRLLTK